MNTLTAKINGTCDVQLRNSDVKQSVLKSLWCRMIIWERNSRTRRQLLAMGADQLKDIGISRADALAEGRKPFWK